MTIFHSYFDITRGYLEIQGDAHLWKPPRGEDVEIYGQSNFLEIYFSNMGG